MIQDHNLLNIWQLILSGHEATASWGIDATALCNIEHGISFKLEGTKFKGWVEIIFDELDNCFNIFLRNQDSLNLIQTISTSELITAIGNQPKDIDVDILEKTRNEFGFLKL